MSCAGSCDSVAVEFFFSILSFVQLGGGRSGRDGFLGRRYLVTEGFLVRSVDGTNGMNDWLGVTAHFVMRECYLGQGCIRFVLDRVVGNLTHPCVCASWLFTQGRKLNVK